MGQFAAAARLYREAAAATLNICMTDEANPQARGLAPALPREASADAGGRDQEADPDGNLIFPFWRAVCELEAAVLDVSPKPELFCSTDFD